jgi:AmmeMemoRadiSam system protein B
MSAGDAERGRIREPIADGILYPAEEKTLTDTISALVEAAEADRRDAFGIITPHASFEFVGPLMAQAYRSAAERIIETVVILAPIHKDDGGNIVLPKSRFFQTPLGVLAVDQETVKKLLGAGKSIVRDETPYQEEHAVEVQLPFVQVLFPGCSIVPVMVGRAKNRNVKILADALREALADRLEKTLFVATTNMSAYRPKKHSVEEAKLLMDLIERGDASEILEAVSNKKVSAHGALCIAVLLSLGSFRARALGGLSSDSLFEDRFKAIQYAAVSLFPKG